MGETSKYQVINPPNMLQAKVGRKLQGNEDDFLRNAEKALEALQGEFTHWLGEDIQKLVDASKAFFAEPTSDEKYQTLRCAAHDLKGLGVTYEYPLITSFAAALNSLLDAHGAETPPQKRIVDAHINAIRAVHAQNIKSENHKMAHVLLKELRALTQG